MNRGGGGEEKESKEAGLKLLSLATLIRMTALKCAAMSATHPLCPAICERSTLSVNYSWQRSKLGPLQ